MNDYIKRSEALDRFTYEHGELIPEILKHGELNEISVRDIKSVLRSLPAADVVEVRHGRWGEYESFPLTPSLNGHPCSECGMRFSTSAIPVMKYCPNCGARMDKEDKHEAD